MSIISRSSAWRRHGQDWGISLVVEPTGVEPATSAWHLELIELLNAQACLTQDRSQGAYGDFPAPVQMDISNSAGLRMLELILIALLSGDDKTRALQLAE